MGKCCLYKSPDGSLHHLYTTDEECPPIIDEDELIASWGGESLEQCGYATSEEKEEAEEPEKTEMTRAGLGELEVSVSTSLGSTGTTSSEITYVIPPGERDLGSSLARMESAFYKLKEMGLIGPLELKEVKPKV